MHIVTAGSAYIDIDVYGASVALAELLRLQGEEALAASNAHFNASVPDSLRQLDVQFDRAYKPSPDDVYTIVDLSDPRHFDFGATPENVVAVIDHHLGFEDFWTEKLGNKSRIEFIGAACTQVYEIWKESGLINNMSPNSSKLLACGILDNTLNLKAKITTERDKDAYAELAERAGLPDDWPEKYFLECQDYMAADLAHSIKSDAKNIEYPQQPQATHVGQLTLWNAKDFIVKHKQSIVNLLTEPGKPWFMNFIDIHTGRSVFLCKDQAVKSWLEQTLGVTFDEDTATADRMWLRKEMMKQAIESATKAQLA